MLRWKKLISYWTNRVLDIFKIVITTVFSVVVYILINEDIADCYGVLEINRVDLNIDSNLEELLELRYLDDYMEEPIEIDVDVYSDPSYLEKFIDLFTRKSNKQYNLYADYIHSKDNLTQVITIKCSDVNLDSDKNLCLHSERPQIVSNILKHNLDVAIQNIVFLNDKILQLEISQTKKNNIIQDALSLCKQAIDGSPFVGGNSPFLGGDSPIIGQQTEYKWSSPIID